MTHAHIAWTGLAIGLVVHTVIAAIQFVRSPESTTDFDRYYQIASGTGRPYVDYEVEYPVGTLLVFKALAAPGTRTAFGCNVVAANAAADALITGALWWGWGISAAAYYVVVAIPISGLLFSRIDFWSMAAATLGVAAWQRRRLWPAALALAAGASLKLWPLVFSTSLATGLTTDFRRARSAIAVLVIAGGSLAAAILAISGASAIVQVLTFRSAHGWQIESTIGSLVHLLTNAAPHMESGSWRIGVMSGTKTTLLFAAAMPLALWTSWRGFKSARAGVGWLASVSWLLVLSALLSPQYVGWLIPGGAIAWAERERGPAIVTASVVGLTQAFWTVYGDVVDGARFAMLLVVLRNAVLLVLAIVATATLVRNGDRCGAAL